MTGTRRARSTGGPAAGSGTVEGIVYGMRFRGDVPAAYRPYLWPGGGPTETEAAPVELTHRRLDGLPLGTPLWESQLDSPSGPERFALFRRAEGFVLSVEGQDRGLFRCAPGHIEVAWEGPAAAAAHHLFAYALPLWLEDAGVPVLHGSAVILGGRAVGFLAPSGTGKSVLCAELVRRGCGFLADDGLALRRGPAGWICPAGPPLLRLWPSGLEGALALAAEPLPRVHRQGDKRRLPLGDLVPPPPGGTGKPDASLPTAPPDTPLAALYLLRRRPAPDGAVTVAECPPREALVRLVEHGIAAAPAAALGRARRRFELLAEAAASLPVRHLTFPSAPDAADRVLEAIRGDLRPGAP